MSSSESTEALTYCLESWRLHIAQTSSRQTRQWPLLWSWVSYRLIHRKSIVLLFEGFSWGIWARFVALPWPLPPPPSLGRRHGRVRLCCPRPPGSLASLPPTSAAQGVPGVASPLRRLAGQFAKLLTSPERNPSPKLCIESLVLLARTAGYHKSKRRGVAGSNLKTRCNTFYQHTRTWPSI